MARRTKRHFVDYAAAKRQFVRLLKEGKNPEVEEHVWIRGGVKRREYDLTYDI